MELLSDLLTFVLVVTCLLLMLLILIQLPKKESGAGIAFGGGAADALFGAGSGTVLTHVTKYIATFFLSLSLLLVVLHAQTDRGEGLQEELRRRANMPAPAQTNEIQQSPVLEDITNVNQLQPETSGQPVEPLSAPGTFSAPPVTDPTPAPQ